MVPQGGWVHPHATKVPSLLQWLPNPPLSSAPGLFFCNALKFLKRVPSFCLSFSGLGLVFIHMESSLYSLPCSPIGMEVADPTYRWVQHGAGKVLAPLSCTVRSKQL